MEDVIWYDETQHEWATSLVGKRIFGVTQTEGERPEDELGEIILDDGTELMIRPNKGGCTCGSGDYYITHLKAGSGGLITSAKVVHTSDTTDDENMFELFVMCEGVAGEEKIMQIVGSDGNGHYGTGYLVKVSRVS